MVQGKGAIVLRVQNHHPFVEHATLMQAKAEASRLAQTVGGDFVVFVPVAVVSPAPRTVEKAITLPDQPTFEYVAPQQKPRCGHPGCLVGRRCFYADDLPF